MLTEWGISPENRQSFTLRSLVGVLVMVACGVISVLAVHTTGQRILVGVLMTAAEAGLVSARRILPTGFGIIGVAVAVGTGLAVMVLAPNGLGEVPVLAGASVLPFHLPAGAQRRVGVGVVAAAFGILVWWISGSPAGLLAGVAAWFLADRSVDHAALVAERNRAVALLAEVQASRLDQREAAAAEERNRIAREMHDVLAHSLAGLSVQLQAIRAVAAREGVPASVTGPLDRAAELARDGVQEARSAVGALRAPPSRGVEDLPGLVGAFPGSAELAVTGTPAPLAPEAGHAVYRAVQEAMTNAARYATGSPIDVALDWGATDSGATDWGATDLVVTVRDHGLPPGSAPSGVQGSGTGIKSMIDRVEAVGGSLSAGSDPAGPGWRVQVRIPLSHEGDPVRTSAAHPFQTPPPAPSPTNHDDEHHDRERQA